MEEKKWYILWSSTMRATKTIEYIASEEKVDLWIPSFTQIDLKGDEKILPIYPQYYFISGTLDQCFKIEDLCKKYRYSGIEFLKSDKYNLYFLSDEEIKTVKEVEQNFTINYTNKCSLIEKGSRVYVLSGPLSNIEGIVSEVKSKMVQVTFTFFQRELNLWIPIMNCKPVS